MKFYARELTTFTLTQTNKIKSYFLNELRIHFYYYTFVTFLPLIIYPSRTLNTKNCQNRYNKNEWIVSPLFSIANVLEQWSPQCRPFRKPEIDQMYFSVNGKPKRYNYLFGFSLSKLTAVQNDPFFVLMRVSFSSGTGSFFFF